MKVFIVFIALITWSEIHPINEITTQLSILAQNRQWKLWKKVQNMFKNNKKTPEVS